MLDELKVFTGNAHPALAQQICDSLEIPLGKAEVFKFANDNTFVRILDNVRERDVFVIQPICSPVNDNLMELLIMIDALKRASAARITAVMPYYGYGRTDKKDQPRVPITARLVADLVTTAGANRVLTMDLHSEQIQGFFNIPVDELTALSILSRHFKENYENNLVTVATDVGFTKQARDFAAKLQTPLAIIEKRRMGNKDKSQTLNLIGDVKGKRALLVDDEIATGGSIVSAIQMLKENGASEVYVGATHPIFSGPAIDRLKESDAKGIVVTDTVPVPENKRIDKITVLPIAPLVAEAIKRIHTGMSIGAMFE
ncbi:MAG: ribose-phosphate pyrophosphokinase [Chloroflexi bacterium]|nr:ribose-phosphate pyrophosphokinase [Chloroflexota bacterium]MBT7081454.1 ribose-phosphate pyrophosphokinase [Chloroflexota bacterium]MBT7290296.1 ribose-phosphate pyrophosphokinase [Chloroflexota bacterium]